jgi:[histone H3]-lysine4 N-methyltransferase
MTIDEREEAHKNLLSYNKVFDLNVPPPMDDILVYRATVGHKVNHSFRPSTKFDFAKNPRYSHAISENTKYCRKYSK